MIVIIIMIYLYIIYHEFIYHLHQVRTRKQWIKDNISNTQVYLMLQNQKVLLVT